MRKICKELYPLLPLQIVSKLLSVGIIGLSLVIKVPLIINILKRGSTEGLSFGVNFSELLTCLLTAGYNFHFGYIFSTYAESIITGIGILVVLFLMYKCKQISLPEYAVTLFTSGVFTFGFIQDAFPEPLYAANATILTMLVIYSRVSQITLNIKNGSMGVQSAFELLLKIGKNSARLFTTLVEVGDTMLVAKIGVSFILNLLLLAQFFCYGFSGERKVQGKDKKK